MLGAMVGKGGSGKSLNAVQLVVQELQKGRRVVASIRGLDAEELRARFPDSSAGELVVLPPETSEFMLPSNWPFVGPDGAAVPGLLVRPGDLVIIDEASIRWGTGRDVKIDPQIMTFLVTSRQFVGPTGASTDVYWICQDLSQLNARVRNILHTTMVFKSLRHFGLTKRYRVTAFDGSKINRGTRMSSRVERQNERLFGVYESFVGGVVGEVKSVDRRATALTPAFLSMVVCGVGALALGGWYASNYFNTTCRRLPEAMFAKENGEAVLLIKGKLHEGAKLSADSRGQFVRLRRCRWRVGGPNGVFSVAGR